MGARSDIKLLSDCINISITRLQEAEEDTISQLQTSGRTELIMALRICALNRTALSVGVFSLFESMLASHTQSIGSFADLSKYLEIKGESDLATLFLDYKYAINALKHGCGHSYDRLLEKYADLEFTVKRRDDYFFDEGDVSEIRTLVRVDYEFIERIIGLLISIIDCIERHESIIL